MLGVNWVMAGMVKDELWAWKDLVKGKKCLRLIPLAIFWILWEERNRKALESVKEGIDKIQEKWFQILGFSIMGQSLCYMEDLEKIVDILTDL